MSGQTVGSSHRRHSFALPDHHQLPGAASLLLALRQRLLPCRHRLRPLLPLRLRLLLSAHFRLPLRPLLSDQLLLAHCLRLRLVLRQRLLSCWHRMRPLLSKSQLGA